MVVGQDVARLTRDGGDAGGIGQVDLLALGKAIDHILVGLVLPSLGLLRRLPLQRVALAVQRALTLRTFSGASLSMNGMRGCRAG